MNPEDKQHPAMLANGLSWDGSRQAYCVYQRQCVHNSDKASLQIDTKKIERDAMVSLIHPDSLLCLKKGSKRKRKRVAAVDLEVPCTSCIEQIQAHHTVGLPRVAKCPKMLLGFEVDIGDIILEQQTG
jgi:hypothetical protein